MTLSEKIKTIKNIEKLCSEQYSLEERLKRNIKKEIKDKIVQKTNYNRSTISQYLKISHITDNILNRLDLKGENKISLEFLVSLNKLNKFNEQELIEIIDLFRNVKNINKINIIKKISNECKYDNNIEFSLYIINIGKIKKKYVEGLND